MALCVFIQLHGCSLGLRSFGTLALVPMKENPTATENEDILDNSVGIV